MVVRIKCDVDMWALADERASTKPIYKNSHRGIAANQLGCLGEIAAEYWMLREKIDFVNESSRTTHDYRLHNGIRIDVKTKDRTVPPLPRYECSVPEYNHEHQLPDYYLFVSLERDKSFGRSTDIRRYKFAYVLGAIRRQVLDEKGRRWETDQVDPANGTRFWTACINVRISQLERPDATATLWRSSL